MEIKQTQACANSVGVARCLMVIAVHSSKQTTGKEKIT